MCNKKRILLLAGRRFGKTTFASIIALLYMLSGRRVLYLSPVHRQTESFRAEIVKALEEVIEMPKSLATIEYAGGSITSDSGYAANRLRGTHASLLILDEVQNQSEELWYSVGLPMLADTDGSALLIGTPPNIFSTQDSRAADRMWVQKLWQAVQDNPAWGCFNPTSWDNPYLRGNLDALAEEMGSYRSAVELHAQVGAAIEGAIFNLTDIKHAPVPSDLQEVVVAVDPAGGGEDEVGIMVCGKNATDFFVLQDASFKTFSPNVWAERAVACYHSWNASKIVVEKNFGGNLSEAVIKNADPSVNVAPVSATHGKILRAQPVAVLYERGRVYHCGNDFDMLEQQMVSWLPNSNYSPDRLDALVHGITALNKRKRQLTILN